MTIEEVENYYGNLNQACKALDIASQNMTKWKSQGYIPWKQQFRLFQLSKGRLIPDEEDPNLDHRKGSKKCEKKE